MLRLHPPRLPLRSPQQRHPPRGNHFTQNALRHHGPPRLHHLHAPHLRGGLPPGHPPHPPPPSGHSHFHDTFEEDQGGDVREVSVSGSGRGRVGDTGGVGTVGHPETRGGIRLRGVRSGGVLRLVRGGGQRGGMLEPSHEGRCRGGRLGRCHRDSTVGRRVVGVCEFRPTAIARADRFLDGVVDIARRRTVPLDADRFRPTVLVQRILHRDDIAVVRRDHPRLRSHDALVHLQGAGADGSAVEHRSDLSQRVGRVVPAVVFVSAERSGGDDVGSAGDAGGIAGEYLGWDQVLFGDGYGYWRVSSGRFVLRIAALRQCVLGVQCLF
mmetsp:Transcript_30482/g.65856  ORF Transcript_30482/g.65856 Transcript_30482/m.65856 type:complete len:325 (-) Transcript_30482:1082-2056(-)